MTNKLAYTINETCHSLGLGRSTIYRLIAEGQLQTIRIGHRTLVPFESIKALVDNAPRVGREEPRI